MMNSIRPIISTCICCHNASQRIGDTIASLQQQTADPATYEIIVVDNASNDYNELQKLIQETGVAQPPVRLVREERLGLSFARNRAITESLGDYVSYIDDDAIANSRYIDEMLTAIKVHHPDVLGGNVLPLFEAQPPEYMDYSYWPDWSLKHFGNTDRWLNDGEYFIGTNISAKKSLLLQRGFDEKLGRQGANLVGGEEWFLGESCYKRRFLAQAYVFHKVTRQRMTMEYLARRTADAKRQRNQRVNYRWVVNRLPEFFVTEIRLIIRKTIFKVKLLLWVRHMARNSSIRK